MIFYPKEETAAIVNWMPRSAVINNSLPHLLSEVRTFRAYKCLQSPRRRKKTLWCSTGVSKSARWKIPKQGIRKYLMIRIPAIRWVSVNQNPPGKNHHRSHLHCIAVMLAKAKWPIMINDVSSEAANLVSLSEELAAGARWNSRFSSIVRSVRGR